MTSVAIGVTALIAFIFAVRKAYKLFFPISISPSIHFPSNTYQMGAIGADIKTKTPIDTIRYKHEFISCRSLVSDNSRLIDTDYSAKRLFELRSYK